ncbi:PREDICTED: neurexin-4-like isoform X2 [Priapulus caudatus]|nr:PREDICTED: neurexin-4-like isoform X2 [Priapulus caudatus]XP_014677789.1 PREDICTED: neurexin-4-like isoform X2 [Priapulus caudatus]
MVFADGEYFIDPDSSHALPPFKAHCIFSKTHGGITVINHDAEKCLHVEGYENPGDGPDSYTRPISYEGVSSQQIRQLIAMSNSCEQYLRYECKGSLIHSSMYADVVYARWESGDGVVEKYWPGAEPKGPEDEERCACGAAGRPNTCVNPDKFCNCDANLNSWQQDFGLVNNKDHLPITRVKFGDTLGDEEEGYHFVGPLVCYDGREPLNLYEPELCIGTPADTRSGDVIPEYKTREGDELCLPKVLSL